ncbi:MAG: hypothetical protein J4F50_05050 [Acidimicrobiia bacterium]|nr:hypothetical protein [Acidimicrobiia bacterium]
MIGRLLSESLAGRAVFFHLAPFSEVDNTHTDPPAATPQPPQATCSAVS